MSTQSENVLHRNQTYFRCLLLLVLSVAVSMADCDRNERSAGV